MIIIPLFAVLVFYGYLEYSLIGDFPRDVPSFWILSILLTLPFLSQLWMILIYFRSKEHDVIFGEEFFKRSAFFSMGLISFLFSFTVLRDLSGLILHFFSQEPVFYHSITASLTIIALSLTALLYGYLHAKFRIFVPTIRIPILNLPTDLENFKIVQLSDVHFGTGPDLNQVKRIVNRALTLEPDLFVLTGDIIDGALNEIKRELQELAKLRAPFGVYFVLGNHEYYWNAEGALLTIREAGAITLVNESVLIRKNSGVIQLAGIDDIASKHFGKMGPKHPPVDTTAHVKIMLGHQPQTAKVSSELGYDLQLSGHTHGGQFFPWNILVKYIYPVSGGLGKVGKMWLYVSHGTGFWGPPIRLGTKSEITQIFLTKNFESGKN